MKVEILRDSSVAQQFLLQGLWFQRAVPATAATIKHALEWALEIVAGGQPLPPLGAIADVGHVAFGADREARTSREQTHIPGLPPALMRAYEDHVLGKLYVDWSFERASDALRRFQGRDRALGLAYVIKQFRERGGIGGVELAPGVIRTLMEAPPDELLRRGWEAIVEVGPLPQLIEMYEALIAAARRMAEVLALEDVIALEQRTALADMGQYVAHRQVLQVAKRLEDGLPRQKVKPLAGRREVPTRVLDEDTYPVGGFTSISTKGSVESMLHSQLAYMETEAELRPDLFDIKYVRDELYYYSRDENQFLRRRRTFLFCLYPDLVKARFQDPELPVQRIVMILGLLIAAVRKLADWLSADALVFEFLVVTDKEKQALSQEAALLQMLLREQIENKLVRIASSPAPAAIADESARNSLCHVLAISSGGAGLQTQQAVTSELVVAGPRPKVRVSNVTASEEPTEDAVDDWIAALELLLKTWV